MRVRAIALSPVRRRIRASAADFAVEAANDRNSATGSGCHGSDTHDGRACDTALTAASKLDAEPQKHCCASNRSDVVVVGHCREQRGSRDTEACGGQSGPGGFFEHRRALGPKGLGSRRWMEKHTQGGTQWIGLFSATQCKLADSALGTLAWQNCHSIPSVIQPGPAGLRRMRCRGAADRTESTVETRSSQSSKHRS